MSSASAAQKNREKSRHDVLQGILAEILKEEDNKYCADCEAKGPRWASWNIGVFLCIRCAGCHRNLGVHISRVKSVNLDSWTDDQVSIMQQMGNRKAKFIYEALLPENFRRPQTDYALEQFIRAKYEQKRYVDRSVNWEPPKPKPIIDPTASVTPEKSGHDSERSRRQSGGSRSAAIILPPVPSLSTAQGGTTHRNRTSSSSSLSPPLSAKAPTANSGQKSQQPPAPIIDFGFEEQPAQVQQLQQPQQQFYGQETSSISSGIAGLSLSPPAAGDKTVSGQPSLPHCGSSAFEELSFLGAAPTPPQKSPHSNSHHQRSVSNFDLMILDNANKQPNSAVSGTSGSSGGGAHDDILSLYKQQPGQSFATNFPIFPAPAAQSHHRNFSETMAAGGVMYPVQPMGNFQGFGMQQPQQLGMPNNPLQFGFQQSPVVNKPTVTAPLQATSTTASQRDTSFDSLWQ